MINGMSPEQVGWKRLGELGWIRLSECGDTGFWPGVTFLFRGREPAPNGLPYHYAMAVVLPGHETLAFMSDEGLLWAHGPDQLPKASTFSGQPYTLSADWLRRNLSCLGKIDDPEYVWYARRVRFAPVSEARPH